VKHDPVVTSIQHATIKGRFFTISSITPSMRQLVDRMYEDMDQQHQHWKTQVQAVSTRFIDVLD